MLPRNQYYQNLSETIIKNLNKRRMEGYYCATKKEACELALSFVKEGTTVTFGGSQTLFQTGIMDALKARTDIMFLDRNKEGTTPEMIEEIYHDAFRADTYFMSTNAITIDGELVNIDGTGNRVAALVYGPKEVIIVTGMNKVASDLESAYKRVKDIASPPNCIRIGRKTPCASTGRCGDCYGEDCICSQTVITRRSQIRGRIKVILVGEDLGF